MKFIIDITEENLEQLKLEALRVKIKSRKELVEKIVNDYASKLNLKITRD